MLTEIFQPRWLDPASLLGAVFGAVADPVLLIAAVVAALSTRRTAVALAIVSVAYPILVGWMIGSDDPVSPGDGQLDLYIPRFLAIWIVGGIAFGLRRLQHNRRRAALRSRKESA